MKRIIKPGHIARTTCTSCGCEFTFEREDVLLGNQFDSDNIVTCPCCGNAIVIDHTMVPKKEIKK